MIRVQGLKRILFALTIATAALFPLLVISVADTQSANFDYSQWQAESLAAIDGTPTGNWQVSSDGLRVTQTVDGGPTTFFGPSDARGTVVEGIAQVGGPDDDFFGFIFGFSPGESTDAAADYLILDWKRGSQTHDFGSPSCTPGSTANLGMALTRVTGMPTADELWGHENFDAPCSDLNNGAEEKARAKVLANMGWLTFSQYVFRIEAQPDHLTVYVNNTLQIDEAITMPAGGFGFYTFSQSDVRFRDFRMTGLSTPAPTASPTPAPTPTPSPTPSPDPTPTPPPAGPTCQGLTATIVGTEGRDVLRGTNGRDVIVAFGGADIIIARGGDDVICAGDGIDVVMAGHGSNSVFGEDGGDMVVGGPGDEMLHGGPGSDLCIPGGGDDVLMSCERSPNERSQHH